MNQRRNVIIASLVVVLMALAIGFVLGRSSAPREPAGARGAGGSTAAQVYTCSMHPQVRSDRPGKCPICEMPLVPANAAPATASAGGPMLQLSDHALAMASIETTPVVRREVARELSTVGKVQYNESSLATVTARVDGYAERLFVNITGVEIQAGDHLAEIYSPDLLLGQQELLIALQSGQDGPLVEAARFKLKRWGLTDAQVEELVGKKKIADRVTLYSPITGTVIEKTVVENSAFKAGDVLYRVANLDTVWVYLDIYEYDLAWVRFGQTVDVTAEALPGQTFSGMVTFIQPLVNEETRTVRVPVHVENKQHVLKPGMFVSAVIKSQLSEKGESAATGVEGKFACVMHPQVLQLEPGKCPVCGMPLARIPGATSRPAGPPLVIPATAVLDTGTRRIVYVERSRGQFEPRDVVTGPRSGAFFPVLRGVKDGERVVTRGGFLIDSQFQITGQPSLFYPGGTTAGAGAGHQHGGTPAPAAEDHSQHVAPRQQTPAAQPGEHKH